MLFKFKHSAWCIDENVRVPIFMDAFWNTFVRNPRVYLLVWFSKESADCRAFGQTELLNKLLVALLGAEWLPRAPVWQEPRKCILVFIKIFIKMYFQRGHVPSSSCPCPGPRFSPTWDCPWWCSWTPWLDVPIHPHPHTAAQSPGQIKTAIPISKVWAACLAKIEPNLTCLSAFKKKNQQTF